MKMILTLLVMLSLQAYGERIKLPDGWRLPTEKELAGEERDNERNSTNSVSVVVNLFWPRR